MNKLKEMGRAAKRDGIALYLAARDPRVPWTVKALAVLVAAYVLSPIDLIPDFIPVVGYLDELVLLPVAVALIVRSIDPVIMEEHRAAAALLADKPRSLLGAVLIVALWISVALMIAWYFWPFIPA